MKSFITFAFLAFFTGISFSQNQAQSQPIPADAMQGWYQQNSGTTSDAIIPVQFLNRDTGWAGAFYTTNSGDTWTSYQGGRLIHQFLDKLHGWSYSPIGTGWISATIDGGLT